MSAAAVTIGNFDGVHLGHREIVRQVVEKARALGARPVAVTFRPHPQAVLRPEGAPALLTSYEEKRELLLSLGLAEVIELAFTPQLAAMSADEFFALVLRADLQARALVVGHDFAMGHGREGRGEKLADLCRAAGIEFSEVAGVKLGDTLVSSSRIRRCLETGEVADAAGMLRRPFAYRGTVVHGAARGGRIGFPTLNLWPEPGKVLLPLGVYATRVSIRGAGGRQNLPGVTNFGVRPTFTATGLGPGASDKGANVTAPVVETYLLETGGVTEDLHGREIEVGFAGRIRPERKFSGADELRAQIARDVEDARRIHGAGPV